MTEVTSLFTLLNLLKNTISEIEEELENAGASQDFTVLQSVLKLRQCHLEMLKEGESLRSHVVVFYPLEPHLTPFEEAKKYSERK